MYELGSIFNVHLASSSIIFAVIAGGMQYVVLKTGPTLNTNPQMSIMQYILPVMIMIFEGLYLMLVPFLIRDIASHLLSSQK